jgi:hypothetical protein
MLQKSAPRVRAHRERRKQGIVAVVPVPIHNNVCHLLQDLGFVQFPNSKANVATGVAQLLARIEGLPADVAALLKHTGGSYSAEKVSGVRQSQESLS